MPQVILSGRIPYSVRPMGTNYNNWTEGLEQEIVTAAAFGLGIIYEKRNILLRKRCEFGVMWTYRPTRRQIERILCVELQAF